MNSTTCYTPEGPLTLDTVSEIRQVGEDTMTISPICFDFSAVTQVDSSAISLLLDWKRAAQERDVELKFAHMPEHLLVLAGLYGVRDLIISTQV